MYVIAGTVHYGSNRFLPLLPIPATISPFLRKQGHANVTVRVINSLAKHDNKDNKTALDYLGCDNSGDRFAPSSAVFFVVMQIQRSSEALLKASRGGASTRPPIERMAAILSRLQSGAAWINCATLSDELEVSRRTIARDLDFMRDRLNLPIDYDRHRMTFTYGGAQ